MALNPQKELEELAEAYNNTTEPGEINEVKTCMGTISFSKSVDSSEIIVKVIEN